MSNTEQGISNSRSHSKQNTMFDFDILRFPCCAVLRFSTNYFQSQEISTCISREWFNRARKPGPSPRSGIFDGPCLSRAAGVKFQWLCRQTWPTALEYWSLRDCRFQIEPSQKSNPTICNLKSEIFNSPPFHYSRPLSVEQRFLKPGPPPHSGIFEGLDSLLPWQHSCVFQAIK